MASRLQEKYVKEVAPALMEKFGYKNVMEIPKLDKIVINMGIGDARENPKGLEAAVAELEMISGQKPVITKARKSVANFKLREGMPVGTKVTLRADKMSFRPLRGSCFPPDGNRHIYFRHRFSRSPESPPVYAPRHSSQR